LPISSAHQRYGISTELTFFRKKRATDDGLNAQHPEEFKRDETDVSANRLAAAKHGGYLSPILCGCRQRTASRLHILKIAIGKRDLPALGIYLRQAYDLFGF